MSQDDSHLKQHYDVLMRLAKSEAWGRGDLESTLREVTEAAAHTMGIERVNMWLFDEDRAKICCIEHYDRSTGEHSSGGEIAAADYPVYFEALAEERTIVADDAHEDPRTREFSKGYLDVHGITSMLDAPLRSRGEVVGIICHEHIGPKRSWTAEEQGLAGSLADITSLALETRDRVRAEQEVRKLNAELEDRVQERTAQLKAAVLEKQRLLEELQASSVELVERLCELEHKSEIIRTDLERAQVIQRALLPAQPPALKRVHVDALYRPGMNVGGDLYDVVRLDGGRIVLYVADAAGHGVAAAMLSVLFKQRLEIRDEQGHALAPSEALRRVNTHLTADVLSQGLFLTVAYVLLETKTGELCAASAGHTPMLLRRATGENVLLERTGPALGLVDHAAFSEHRLTLRRGDRLMLYTDGLIDRLESVGTQEILGLLVPAMSGDTLEGPDRLRALFEDVERRARDASQGGRDDVTLLMLGAEGGPSTFDNAPTAQVQPLDPEPSSAIDQDWPLWVAESDEEIYLAVHGEGTWTHCETFRRLAQAGLDAGKRLTMDLADCTHLDSAFLGTLQEIAASAPPGRSCVRSPGRTLRALFEELCLESVLEAVLEDRATPPCDPVPVGHDPLARESQQRLLRSHEILCELSEENRERFAGVVQVLRVELGEGD